MLLPATGASPNATARLLARSPNRRRPVVMHHRWEDLLFLHWQVQAAQIQRTLPPGLTVDTFNGEAYVGITPFFMRNVRLTGTPALPWFSFFLELNVRTYVFDQTGAPGVWFYSLDCNRLWAALGARVLGALPYYLAEMHAESAEWIDYSCRRRGTSETARFRHRATGANREAAMDSLEFFLLERYYLFAYRRTTRTLLRGQVAHVPYQFRDAELAEFSTLPAKIDGLGEISRPPDHACMVDGFDVNIFAAEKVSRGDTPPERERTLALARRYRERW
jgi:uncharacterized protein YqjF (DUF2071 family)